MFLLVRAVPGQMPRFFACEAGAGLPEASLVTGSPGASEYLLGKSFYASDVVVESAPSPARTPSSSVGVSCSRASSGPSASQEKPGFLELLVVLPV